MVNLEQLREKLKDAYSWCQIPYPSFTLSNLRARITADKKRLELIKFQQRNAAKAEAAGGVVIEGDDPDKWCRVTFAEKPERSVINALKAAGYRWGAGSWCGLRSALPAEVQP